MQDIHLIESSGGGGRLFAGGDRRLRPHHQHQDLKCPRCESLNTKFCYYNNYNLSQPRHFCKGCRRYWTKGGVLRNVPVGGCVRKTKRSKKPKSKTSIRSSDAVAAAPQERKSSNSGNSSSDSSSLTANTTTATTTPMTKTEVSGSNSTNSTPAMLLNFNESSTRFFNIPQSSTTITTFDPLTLDQSSAGNMPSDIGTFTRLMTSSTDQSPLGFNMAAGISSFPLHQHNTEHVVENHNHPNQPQWDVRMAEMGIESRRSNGGLAGTDDWQDSADEALYDLTGTVDHSYWSQSQWNDHGDHHHHLNYLP